MTETDSWMLVAATQAGDREAFGVLYQRYHPMVHRYISGRLRDWAEAEDLANETFTKALRSIGSVTDQPGRDIGAWFVTIARNLVIDHTKSARYRRTNMTGDIPEPHGNTGENPTEEAVFAELGRESARRRIETGLNSLTPPQRRCVELLNLQEKSIAEVAVELCRTSNAVKSLYSRARRNLATTTKEAA
jgi:RNA polymerase sigma-70 factor, ECF subfamily